MRTTTINGTLLRPSRPLFAIDSTFDIHHPDQIPQGQVWVAYSEVGSAKAYYVVAANVTQSYLLKLVDLHPRPSPSSIFAIRSQLYGAACVNGSDPISTGCVASLWEVSTPSSAPSLFTGGAINGYNPSELLLLASIDQNNWTFFGELEKFVAGSPDRFENLQTTRKSLQVTVKGAPKEQVSVAAICWKNVNTKEGTTLVTQIQLPQTGQQTIKFAC